MSTPTMAIEVLTLPVEDVDRAKDFYVAIGFHLDVDYASNDAFRVVQVTPPGSATSIQFGVGLTDGTPGSVRETYLVVADLEQAIGQLKQGGATVSDASHKTPVGEWDGGFAPGLDPDRGDYASFVHFADPDGNQWVVQERGFTAAT